METKELNISVKEVDKDNVQTIVSFKGTRSLLLHSINAVICELVDHLLNTCDLSEHETIQFVNDSIRETLSKQGGN